MQQALITLSGLFALELLAVVFGAGKLFQRVSDIDKRLERWVSDIDKRLSIVESESCSESKSYNKGG